MVINFRKNLNISYEPADKRKFYRLTNPIKVRIGTEQYSTEDWSVNAFKIKNYYGRLPVGEITEAEFEVNFQGFAVKFSQKIKVLRKEINNKLFIAEYIDVSPRNKEILTYFSKGIITGEFQPFDEVIKHIDIPITENYLHETFAENQKNTLSRKTSVIAYSILGLVVFAYLSYLYYSNIHLLQVDSAFISGRTEIINSPVKGKLSDIFVKKGSTVDKGEELFIISDAKTNRELENKKNEILKNKALLKEKKSKLRNLNLKLNSYKTNTALKLKMQEKLIRSTSEKIDLLNSQLNDMQKLAKKRLISKPEIDEVKKELLNQQENLANINYEYMMAYQNYKDSLTGINPSVRQNDDPDFLIAEINKITDIISIQEKELKYIREINNQNLLKAPFKASIKEVLAYEGKIVDDLTPVLILKNISGEKFIEAYLSEKKALTLKQGMKAKINIPLQGLKIEGMLAKIEKREGNMGRNLTVAIIQPNNTAILKSIDDGTPVKVSFVMNKFSKIKGLVGE